MSPDSRMFRAISFGVFCRSAPSTRAIIRSMKPSPGFWVIRTTMRSESTRVPPVTAERSPPDSRMTGADSPVMADSSTVAMPSTISPSPGMRSPGSTTQQVAAGRAGSSGVSMTEPSSASTLARVSERVLRSVSACALPRPSATASAKLANRTVNHSHPATSPAKRWSTPSSPRSRRNRSVVSTLPISTMNMTGLRTMVRGWSLRKLSPTARFTMAGWKSEALPLAGAATAGRVRGPGRRFVGEGGGGGHGVAPGRGHERPRCSTTGPSARTGK